MNGGGGEYSFRATLKGLSRPYNHVWDDEAEEKRFAAIRSRRRVRRYRFNSGAGETAETVRGRNFIDEPVRFFSSIFYKY